MIYRNKGLKTPVEVAPSESVTEPIENPTDTDQTSHEFSKIEGLAEPATPRTKVYALIMTLYNFILFYNISLFLTNFAVEKTLEICYK